MTIPQYTLMEHTQTSYAWDYPATRDKRLLLTINGANRAVDIMEIGDLVPFKFPVRLPCLYQSPYYRSY